MNPLRMFPPATFTKEKNMNEVQIGSVFLYISVMIGALYGVYVLSRPWRIVVYVILGALHLFVNSAIYALSFINVNNTFGVHTEQLFRTLAEQLSQGAFHEEYLTLPSPTVGILLSAFGFLVLIGGLLSVWAKPRWWTWLSVCMGLIISYNIWAFPQRQKEGKGIAEQNELRRHAYDVVKGKRAEGVSDALLAETITIQLKDFQASYENRKDAQDSADRILSAISTLKPEDNATSTSEKTTSSHVQTAH